MNYMGINKLLTIIAMAVATAKLNSKGEALQYYGNMILL